MSIIKTTFARDRICLESVPIGMDKRCVYTGPGRPALDWFSYSVPNVLTCESDPIYNCTVPGWYRDRVNATQFRRTFARVDPI